MVQLSLLLSAPVDFALYVGSGWALPGFVEKGASILSRQVGADEASCYSVHPCTLHFNVRRDWGLEASSRKEHPVGDEASSRHEPPGVL